MRLILHSSSFYVFGAGILIVTALVLLFTTFSKPKVEFVTTKVERGDVLQLVSVSGVVEAKNVSRLGFPVNGLVTQVFVKEGQTVEAGEVLATLASAKLVAERIDAVASLEKVKAIKDEIVAGPTTEARNVADQTVKNAESALEKVTREKNEMVKNAYRTLLSSSLIARTAIPKETASAPTVSGTYTCENSGQYLIEPYNISEYQSFPYRVSGIDSGRSYAHFESPGPFGNCGLFLQFDKDSDYADSEWVIDIPNKQSSVYQTNLNNYELTQVERDEAIKAAQDALLLAQEKTSLEIADPRTEKLRQADADITIAQARIKAIDADIADRSIVAPFSGIVTDVDVLTGETVTTGPVITLLAQDAFELTARVPEIDITKVSQGQTTEIVFDSKSDELLIGEVAFISPLATEIDGVAYFKTVIKLNENPTWIKSGLNADIDIIIEKSENVLRLPKRFVANESGKRSVLVQTDETLSSKEVVVLFEGNDGFMEITGLNEGDVVVAP
jgi:HlyD family secretion protein